jgi:hypothetical protein
MNLLVIAKAKNRVQDGLIFTKTRTARRVYEKQRARIAEELGNQRLKKITFHTFRHWFGTMMYHETKDIVYVQRKLGHKNINNTLMYIHLDEAYFGDLAEEYDVRKIRTVEEAVPLIENGYVEASEINGIKLFKKRLQKIAGVVRSGAGEFACLNYGVEYNIKPALKANISSLVRFPNTSWSRFLTEF